MTADDAWELIEQDLIPSAREDTRTQFFELLARIWDDAYVKGGDDAMHHRDRTETWPHLEDNPYRASGT